jgi:hypothetical protein
MPTYEFESKDGERVSLFFSIEERPAYGSRRKHKGKWFRRVIESPPQMNVPKFEGASWSAPLWDPLAKEHLPDGRPYFRTRGDWQDYAKKTRDNTTRPMVYDR